LGEVTPDAVNQAKDGENDGVVEGSWAPFPIESIKLARYRRWSGINSALLKLASRAIVDGARAVGYI
jgi:hypothetical protein